MSTLQPVCHEDSALVARITAGDEAAEEEFARKYSERFRYLAHYARVPWQDCQDVAQEALIAALGQMRRGLFRGDSQLGHWLVRIVHGKAMDYWRQRHAGSVVALDEPGELRDFVEGIPAPMTDYELTAHVRETLKTLPAQHQVILLLKRTYGYKIEEIGQMLEMTAGQVSWRLYAAEEMFRQRLRNDKPPASMSANKLLASGDTLPQGSNREQATDHSSFAFPLVPMHRAGDQQTSHRVLLRTRQRIGGAIGRSPLAGMRILLARSAAAKFGGASAGHGSFAGAIADAG
jgi:RNA polymerase sigma-70 factor (ECF subfamily)